MDFLRLGDASPAYGQSGPERDFNLATSGASPRLLAEGRRLAKSCLHGGERHNPRKGRAGSCMTLSYQRLWGALLQSPRGTVPAATWPLDMRLSHSAQSSPARRLELGEARGRGGWPSMNHDIPISCRARVPSAGGGSQRRAAAPGSRPGGSLRRAPAPHAVLHDAPDAQQARVDLLVGTPVPLVAPHDLGYAAAKASRDGQEILAGVKS